MFLFNLEVINKKIAYNMTLNLLLFARIKPIITVNYNIFPSRERDMLSCTGLTFATYDNSIILFILCIQFETFVSARFYCL